MSMISLLCSIIYFIHFNFAMLMLKTIYLAILVLYPLVAFFGNCAVANSLRNNILQDADKDPNNAEFLDFEDDEEDILRKAKVKTVSRKIQLQLWAMTPLTISGCYKLLPTKDFPMQIFFAYWLELILFCAPVIVLQIINNTMMG